MRVLLVSEGVHEASGSLETLVCRIVSQDLTCEWRALKDSKLRLHRGKGNRLFKRAVGWIREAQSNGFDALILLVDRDDEPTRIKEISKAQEENYLTQDFPRALGVAIRSFDAWMLADEQALAKVLGRLVNAQPAPEENDDPKADCERLRSASDTSLRLRELYAQVATVADLACIERRCPHGFGNFAKRLRDLKMT